MQLPILAVGPKSIPNYRVWDMKNLQEQVKKAFYQKWFWPFTVVVISKFLQIIGFQARISKVLIYSQNIIFKYDPKSVLNKQACKQVYVLYRPPRAWPHWPRWHSKLGGGKNMCNLSQWRTWNCWRPVHV